MKARWNKNSFSRGEQSCQELFLGGVLVVKDGRKSQVVDTAVAKCFGMKE